jgi:hypothetical protein
MSITFNEFILEANIAGSRPRPRGSDALTPAERARVGRSDRSPIKRTGGGVSYVSVAPETEPPNKPQKPTSSSSKEYVQKWIPGFPPPKNLKVKPHKKPKLNKPDKGPKSPKVRTTQLKLKLKEFINLYQQSIINS